MRRIVLLLVAATVIGVPLAVAQPVADPATPRPLIIGTKESPPFAMRTEDGGWTGLSIELWRDVANDLGLRYEIREYDLVQLFEALEKREIDVAVGALTINANREKRMDFSHPVYSTGLSVVVRARSDGGVMDTARSLFSWSVAKVVLGMLLLLTASGAFVWLAERRANAAQFGGSPLHGIGAGLWWSAVTMTTVGYGDKAPVTAVGRIVALGWMFAAIIVFSFFTASITSTLTVQRLTSDIQGADDLPGLRVGTLAGSTSSAFLDRRDIPYVEIAGVEDGVKAVNDGEIDAFVYDAPILQYAAKTFGDSLIVLPKFFRRQDYGFALPEGSELREPVNRALLIALTRERWQALLDYYLER